MTTNIEQANKSLSHEDPVLGTEWEGPAILLVDLDAFFASVEQHDHPGWRGKPVIVGGDPNKRGVVSTASYEAREYGVHSAMPSSTARRLCPDAIWTQGNFSRYREVSNQVMAILHDETPHVQQVSIDEAFMDVTPTSVNVEHPAAIARRIQHRVDQLGVSCSIGVGSSKSIAKIASDVDKPRGLTVVMPGSELNFIDGMPVRSLSGIGPSAEKKLHANEIYTLGDLYRCDDSVVIRALGQVGRVALNRVRGLEDVGVSGDDDVKSVSNETSFAKDLTSRDDISAAVRTMAAKVGRRLRKKGLAGHTLSLKVRHADFSVHSTQRQIDSPCDDEFALFELLEEMLDDVWTSGIAVRLVGVGVSGFDTEYAFAEQLSLFDESQQGVSAPSAPSRKRLIGATDRVKERFGESSLRFGRELRLQGSDTGSSSKDPADYK